METKKFLPLPRMTLTAKGLFVYVAKAFCRFPTAKAQNNKQDGRNQILQQGRLAKTQR